MGIKNLLDLLREYQVEKPINVKEFAGRTIAIDTYCLLHRGALAMVDRHAVQRDNGQYVRYVFKYVEMIMDNGVKPILVFDGFALPAKSITRQKRREHRESNRRKADEYRRAGELEKARSALMQAVEITSEMAYAVIRECRTRGVDYIVAPYEADAQLAYLQRTGVADAVWTVDADLLLFGCSKVIYNLDECGRGLLYEVPIEKLREVCGITDTRSDFRFEHFRRMCILSGCDYLESPRGIGLRKARTVIQKAVATGQTDARALIAKLCQFAGPRCLIEPGYYEAFVEAEITFLHQLVYDPLQRRLVPLTPYSESVYPDVVGNKCGDAPLSPSKRFENGKLDFAGEYMPSEQAHWLAVGNVNVKTRQAIADAKFDPSTNRAFLERVCSTLRERADKFRRAERSRARLHNQSSSQVQSTMVFSFEQSAASVDTSHKLTKDAMSIWDPRFAAVLRGEADCELQLPPMDAFLSRSSLNGSLSRSPLKRKLLSDESKRESNSSQFSNNDTVLKSYLSVKRAKTDPSDHVAKFSGDLCVSPAQGSRQNHSVTINPCEQSPVLVRRARNCGNRFSTQSEHDSENKNRLSASQSVSSCSSQNTKSEIGSVSRYFDSPPNHVPLNVVTPQATIVAQHQLSVTSCSTSSNQSLTAAVSSDKIALDNASQCTSAISHFHKVAKHAKQQETDEFAIVKESPTKPVAKILEKPVISSEFAQKDSDSLAKDASKEIESISDSDSDVEIVFASPAPMQSKNCSASRTVNQAARNERTNATKVSPKSAPSTRTGYRVSGLTRFRQSTSSTSSNANDTNKPRQSTLHRWFNPITTPQ